MTHSILQVYPREDFIVFLYFNDGTIRRYDASKLIQEGVFKPLQDKTLFVSSCTVMNGTLAWDISGKRNPYDVLDLDAENLYQTCAKVSDPLAA